MSLINYVNLYFQGASSDSDLEKIELSVAIDGCESKIVAEDETDTIETGMSVYF